MKATVIICKGDMNYLSHVVKVNEMNIILRFIEMCVPKCEFMQDDSTMVLNMPAKDGDQEWVRKNVLNKVYLDGTYNDTDATEKARKLHAIYEGLEDHEGKVGLDLIKWYLKDLYLDERGASIYVR